MPAPRRLPAGSIPVAPTQHPAQTGAPAFSVALNEDRTRLLRSWREAVAPSPGFNDTTELNTAELRLDPAAE